MTEDKKCGNCVHWHVNGWCFKKQNWTKGSKDSCDLHEHGTPSES